MRLAVSPSRGRGDDRAGGRRSGGSDDDPIVALATRVIGGPRGRYARDPRPDTFLRRLAGVFGLGACLALAVGFLQKSHCVQYGWAAPEAYWKACYSDFPAYATHPGLIGGGLPYTPGATLPQPLGTGSLLWFLSLVVPDEGFARQQYLFVAWAVTAAILLLVTVAATVWTCRRRPERAAHVAFSPLIVTVALVSPDLLGVALTAVAVWLWSRENPTAAGVVFGLAIATRTYPVLLLVVLGALAVRAGVVREWARTAGVAVLTTTVLLGLAVLAYGSGPLAPYQVWATAGAELGSPWYLATLAGRPIQLGVLTTLTVLGWVLAVVVGGMVTFGASVRPRVGEIALIVVVIVLLTSKALPVQSSIWLLPLIALAGLRWRDHLVWAGTEVLAFVAVWLYLGGLDDPRAALPPAWYAFFLVLRLAGLSWLAIAAARQALGRRLAVPDDAGGPIAGRPDAVVVRYVR